ncbi:MAG TPA: DUF3017 domain-containing protein [Pedococcus sp.]|jgi:hypothetical protein
MTAPRLGWWWAVLPVLVLGLVVIALHHVRAGGYVLAAGAGLAALLRLVLPKSRSGGLAVRSRAADVTTLAVLALALAVITNVLDLRPRS